MQIDRGFLVTLHWGLPLQVEYMPDAHDIYLYKMYEYFLPLEISLEEFNDLLSNNATAYWLQAHDGLLQTTQFPFFVYQKSI